MNGLDPLVEGLFDYAGMFPPAELPFEAMVKEAAGHPRRLRRPELVGSAFVLPMDHLERLDVPTLQEAGWPSGQTAGVCVVGVEAAEAEQAAHGVLAWNEKHQHSDIPRRATSLEVHTEHGSADFSRAGVLETLGYLLTENQVRVYFEPRWDDAQWNERMDKAFALLDRLHENMDVARIGLKVRCGGGTALAPETLAKVMAGVVERRIPFKASQGLHHVVAGEGPAGFLGLTVALRLMGAGKMDAEQAALCIAEKDPARFSFDGGIAWGDHQASLGDLGRAMGDVRFSIGSCDLKGPDRELVEAYPDL